MSNSDPETPSIDDVHFSSDCENLPEESFDGFFDGWPRRPDATRLVEILRGSTLVELAIDTRSGTVVGFANALSDGVLSAFIPLLEVRHEFRGRGIGSALIGRLGLRLRDHYSIDLVCDESLVPFYETRGFSRLVGMAFRNRMALALSENETGS